MRGFLSNESGWIESSGSLQTGAARKTFLATKGKKSTQKW
jgi:hypothetical protein